MAGRIPRSFIDDLLARADIVELIDRVVPLKKAGKNYQACCPFHNEKTPSFTVAPDKQFYHCFGCGAHGNAISFLMEYDGLEFVDAVEELAKLHNLEVPREDSGPFRQQTSEQKQQLEDDYKLMDSAAKFYAHQLRHHHQANSAVDYLKSRGLSGEVVKRFEIGYAPPEWDAVLKQFGKNPATVQQLIDLKLVNKNDKQRTYDFFRDRITFPIRDKRGRVIGFGGRILSGDGPKYLNSPETRIFHKGSELYGFYQAKQANRKLERIVIVEGYMDVVALAQFGIDYAVAALGTATTPEHVQLLLRNTSELICCYDGDRAGRDAAWRALENTLPHLKDGCQVKFLFLPDGEDPDTMVRKEVAEKGEIQGKEAFEERLKKAKPLSQFLFEHLKKRHEYKTLDGKANLRAEALPLLERIPGDSQKEVLNEQLAILMGERDKFEAKKRQESANKSLAAKKIENKTPTAVKDSPVRRIIQLLLLSPDIAKQVSSINEQALLQINIKGISLLREVHEACFQNSEMNGSQILERFRGHIHYKALATLMMEEMPEERDLIAEYIGNFQRLIQLQLQNRLEELTDKSRMTSLTREERQEIIDLTRAIHAEQLQAQQ